MKLIEAFEIDQMTIDRMTIDRMTIDQMTIDRMTIDQMKWIKIVLGKLQLIKYEKLLEKKKKTIAIVQKIVFF